MHDTNEIPAAEAEAESLDTLTTDETSAEAQAATVETPPLFAERQLIQVPIQQFAIHPALKGMAALDSDDPRYLSMQAAWRESGLMAPLYALHEGDTWLIADGRHRYWFARRAGLATLPVIPIQAGEVEQVVMHGILGRSHATYGQRAYLAVPYLQSFFDAARQRRAVILRSGGGAKDAADGRTLDELAAQVGVSLSTLNQARALHDALAKLDDAGRKKWETLIFAEDPISIGAALSGIAGAEAGGKGPARNSALHRIGATFANFAKAGAACGALKAKDRDTLLGVIAETLATADAAFLTLLDDSLQRAQKAIADAAKKARKAAPADALRAGKARKR